MKSCLNRSGIFVHLGVAAALWAGLAGARLGAVEVVDNFTLPYHTNDTVNLNLHDFAGNVILLDFFFATCSFCQGAAPSIKQEIADYYRTRNGNPDGVPLVEIYINIGWFDNLTTTDAFIAQYGMQIVADDFRSNCCWYEILQSFYDNPEDAGTPHFVVINGVTNSPSHEAWQILYNDGGFLGSPTVTQLRAAIDSVWAPNLPPNLANPARLTDGRFQFALTGQKGRTNVIEYSTDLRTWNTLGTVVNAIGSMPIIDNQAPPHRQRFYRARVKE